MSYFYASIALGANARYCRDPHLDAAGQLAMTVADQPAEDRILQRGRSGHRAAAQGRQLMCEKVRRQAEVLGLDGRSHDEFADVDYVWLGDGEGDRLGGCLRRHRHRVTAGGQRRELVWVTGGGDEFGIGKAW
jgi:hypothetical protein